VAIQEKVKIHIKRRETKRVLNIYELGESTVVFRHQRDAKKSKIWKKMLCSSKKTARGRGATPLLNKKGG